MPELYEEIKSIVLKEVRGSEFVSVSCDGWTDVVKNSIVNIMVHTQKGGPYLYESVDTVLNPHTG